MHAASISAKIVRRAPLGSVISVRALSKSVGVRFVLALSATAIAQKHIKACVDDGQCGGPGVTYRGLSCCFPSEQYEHSCFPIEEIERHETREDPEFHKLFMPYYEEFNRRVHAWQEKVRLERLERRRCEDANKVTQGDVW